MVLLFTISYMVVFFLGARHFAKREGYYSTVAVFGVTGFIYYMLIPLEMSLGGIDSVYLAGREEWVPPDIQWKISALGTLALLGFLSGYYYSAFVPYARESPSTGMAGGAPGLRRIPQSLVVLAGTALLCLLAFYREQLAEASTYAGHVAMAYRHPLFTLLAKYVVLSFALIAGLTVIKRPAKLHVAVPFVVPIAMWGIYSSDKNPILLALLGIAAYFFGPRSTRPRTLILILVASTIFLLLIPLFSLYRAGVAPADFRNEYYFGSNRIDAAGPMYSLIDTLHENPNPKYGATYLRELVLLVPKFLWPDRPPGMAETFAQSRIVRWQPGQGLGFSPLAEAYINFWWFGPFIQYFAFALLWGKAWGKLKRLLVPINPHLWNVVYCVIAYYLITLLHRNSTVMIKGALQLILPVVALVLLFDLRKRQSSRSRTSTTKRKTLFSEQRPS